MTKQIITLSDNAAARIKEIMSKDQQNSLGVRVGVKSGGCAGMSYIMEYAEDIKDNEENLKEEVIDFSYAKITPSNLIDSDEFNNEFFKKIDEIENSILNDSSIEDIRKIYDLKIEYLSNYNNEDKNNEIAEINVTIINPLKYGLGFIFKKRLIKLLFILLSCYRYI